MWKKFILIIFKTQTLCSLCCERSDRPVVMQKCVEGGGRRGGLNSGTQFITPEKQGKAVMILTHTRCVALWAAYLQIHKIPEAVKACYEIDGMVPLFFAFTDMFKSAVFPPMIGNETEWWGKFDTTSTLVSFITMRGSLVLLLSLD